MSSFHNVAAHKLQRDLTVECDVLVVARKVVSKADGRFIRLDSLAPGPQALELAAATGKDPRFIEAVLAETVEVVRYRPGVIVVETHHGVIMANAGIDRSTRMLVKASSGRRAESHTLLLSSQPLRSLCPLSN